jgi:ribosome-associated heat shock protein Hsp15
LFLLRLLRLGEHRRGAHHPDYELFHYASPHRAIANPRKAYYVSCATIVAVTGVRIDKWLWAARFFKTRSLAARACELGRISSNGQTAKPAREVHPADMLRVKNEGGEFEVEVLQLSEMRGPAAVAHTLYRETEASREARARLAEQRRTAPTFDWEYEGRPSKRDRRVIDRLRRRG